MEPLTITPRDQHPPENNPNTANHEVEQSSESGFLAYLFKVALFALIVVIPFRLYIAQPFIVSGASMHPTFTTGQYLIVDQVTYHLEEPKRWDVVIFKYPNDPSKFFIKRVIGLPGETVELANGITTITDPATGVATTIDEPYLMTDRTNDHLSITLSSNEYFVMGDNRSASSDSRVWGPVPRRYIVGRALIRLLPPSSFGLFPGEYHTPDESTEYELQRSS